MSSTKIYSFADNMRKTITAQTNALNLLESISKSITTNDTVVTYDYESLKDGQTNTYQIPSYAAVNNRLRAIERNLDNLSSGKATLTLSDGSRRKVELTNLPQVPSKISNIANPTTFNINSNWFFEDLMFPGLTVSIDLTGQIEDSADRVKISRIILDAKNSTVQSFWTNTLQSNIYEYNALKSLLAYNNITYSEDIETIELPLTTNSVTGSFQVIEDPEIINGNTWYTFNTISYASIDENGKSTNNNYILSVGDQLSYNNTLFSILEVDQNQNKVRLKIINGSAFPGVYSEFKIYQDPFRSKTIEVRFGAHEYDIIYIKGVNEDFNLISNQWSDPIQFETDTLLFADNVNINLADYYAANVVDWGAQWIAEAKEHKITAYYGHTPNIPTLNADDLRVVQINTQINAAMDNADIKKSAADIETTRSEIESLKQTISQQKTILNSITSTAEYNKQQSEIASNTTNLKNLQAQYTSLVNTFQSSVAENKAVLEYPKYHIRGFFPIPVRKYLDDNQTVPEEIIGFDIAYKYIKTDNTGVQLNTFEYTDTDGTSVVQGTFTDWNIVQSALKTRVYNSESGLYEWKTENVADGSEVNINQIDIPITKGEKVQIKVRTISEAGYPQNPLKSDWSESIIVEFPGNLNTSNEIADLVEEINDDALQIAISNTLDSLGVTTHLDDTIPNVNSVNGIYFKHVCDNIAYEDIDTEAGTTTTVSLQEKLNDVEARLKLLENYINNQAGLLVSNNSSTN